VLPYDGNFDFLAFEGQEGIVTLMGSTPAMTPDARPGVSAASLTPRAIAGREADGGCHASSVHDDVLATEMLTEVLVQATRIRGAVFTAIADENRRHRGNLNAKVITESGRRPAYAQPPSTG
jgi:hypothetical protein